MTLNNKTFTFFLQYSLLQTKTNDFLDTTIHGISNYLNQDLSFDYGFNILYNGEHCVECFINYITFKYSFK